MPPNTTLLFAANRFDTETIADFDLDLVRIADLNNDGDFADANEQVSEVALDDVTTCAGASAHLACGIVSNSVIVNWKNSSTLQVNNTNFTLVLSLETALNAHINAFGVSFRNETFCLAECRGNLTDAVARRNLENLTRTESNVTTSIRNEERNLTTVIRNAELNLTVAIRNEEGNLSVRINTAELRFEANVTTLTQRVNDNLTVTETRVKANITTFENNVTVVEGGVRKGINHTLGTNSFNQDETARKTKENLTGPIDLNIDATTTAAGSTDQNLSESARFLILLILLAVLGGLVLAGGTVGSVVGLLGALALAFFLTSNLDVLGSDDGNQTTSVIVLLATIPIMAFAVGNLASAIKESRRPVADED